MAVAWTEHRFAGGALALDVANTVVLRGRPETFDRFDDASELSRFAEASSRYRANELSDQQLVAADAERDHLVDLREAIDALFRAAAGSGQLPADRLSAFLSSAANALKNADAGVALDVASVRPLPLLAATALSAIALLTPDQHRRIRSCDNCGWLYLDRSKNRSRRWCDMSVCGNRSKAKRHYARQKEAT